MVVEIKCGSLCWDCGGVISYAPLLVCRQYASEQFILATYGLDQLEFAYGDSGYAA